MLLKIFQGICTFWCTSEDLHILQRICTLILFLKKIQFSKTLLSKMTKHVKENYNSVIFEETLQLLDFVLKKTTIQQNPFNKNE